jgi:hypothetical protein
MKKIALVMVLAFLLSSVHGFAQKKVESYADGIKLLNELVGKIVLFDKTSSKVVGEVTQIKKDDVYMKRSKLPWVEKYVKDNKKNDVKAAPKKEDYYFPAFPEVKIYILEQGKEPELFMNGMDLLGKMYFRYYFLEKVKVSGQEFPVKENTFHFEDDKININWNLEPDSYGRVKQFAFALTNKTSDTIKVVWDETSFVDKNAGANRIFHSGIKYIERNNPQAPTMVPSETKITDIIIPTENAYFSSEWNILPIYSTWWEDNTKTPEGPETMRLILTLQIGEEKVNYNFYFKGVIKHLEEWPREMWKTLCNRIDD